MPRAIQHGVARIGATMAQQLRRQILKEPQSAWVSLRNSTGSEAFRPLRPPQSLACASITCSDVGSAGYSFLMYLVNFARLDGSERRSPRGDRNEFRSTLRWTRSSRATRQTWTRVNVSETCYNAQSPSAPRHTVHTGFIAVLAKIGLVGQGSTRQRKQMPGAPSLRVLRVSAVNNTSTAETPRARRGGA